MKRLQSAAAFFAAALLVSGCMSGPMSGMVSGPASAMVPGIYIHIRQPLTLDMNRTPVVLTCKAGDIKHIQLDWAGVAWDSAAIGDIARTQGMQEIYFADLEIFSILRYWNQYTVHVYGQ